MYLCKKVALEYLQKLINQPLIYGYKSSDLDLYDIGFGEFVEIVDSRGKRSICSLVLHPTCNFKVIWKNGKRETHIFYGNTSHEEFQSEIEHLVGLTVKRVALSDKNDLWLDLQECWIVFATFEDGEESWRFFDAHKETPHLVASDSWLEF